MRALTGGVSSAARAGHSVFPRGSARAQGDRTTLFFTHSTLAASVTRDAETCSSGSVAILGAAGCLYSAAQKERALSPRASQNENSISVSPAAASRAALRKILALAGGRMTLARLNAVVLVGRSPVGTPRAGRSIPATQLALTGLMPHNSPRAPPISSTPVGFSGGAPLSGAVVFAAGSTRKINRAYGSIRGRLTLGCLNLPPGHLMDTPPCPGRSHLC